MINMYMYMCMYMYMYMCPHTHFVTTKEAISKLYVTLQGWGSPLCIV